MLTPARSSPARTRRYARCSFAALATASLLLSGRASKAQTQLTDFAPPKNGQKPPPKEKPDAGDQKDEEKPAWYEVAGQTTFIIQHLSPFHSPYEGENSFRSRSEDDLSNISTLFLGVRVTKGLEAFVNPEFLAGSAPSEGEGLGGYSNSPFVDQPGLINNPYFARYFLRWRIPTGRGASQNKDAEVRVGTSENIIGGKIPARRIVVTAGKFAVNDIFDPNLYANNDETQFVNAAFVNNLAWDYAQDAPGYSQGITVAWVNPDFTLRAGSFQMPSEAGGRDLAGDLEHNRGDQFEAEARPHILGSKRLPAAIRLLAFRNFANAGRYRDALAQAQQTGAVPDTTAVRSKGTVKFGYGLNFEQALADGGATGIFGRYGWNNGATESYAFAECDRALSFGGQVSGAHWQRKDDRIGLAWAQNDLSAAHRDYLAAGGVGFSLGDGKLRYKPERILEAYYSYQLSKPLAVSLDYQFINNPGYNQDRGPASLISLRLHYEFGL